MFKTNPYLYLLIRNDLDSMNAGKAVAHGAHAANQFTHEFEQWRMKYDLKDKDTPVDVVNQWKMYQQWLDEGNGFGTTITLSVSLRELQTAVAVAESIPGLRAGETIDPTYPYVLHQEYARLINHGVLIDIDMSVSHDVSSENVPTPIGDNMMLCLREEITAAYVFGDKSQARMVVGNFPLMP